MLEIRLRVMVKNKIVELCDVVVRIVFVLVFWVWLGVIWGYWLFGLGCG